MSVRASGIATLLSPNQRRLILAAAEPTEEFRKLPRKVGVLALNNCRRLGLVECEDAIAAVWRYRLTRLGQDVREILEK